MKKPCGCRNPLQLPTIPGDFYRNMQFTLQSYSLPPPESLSGLASVLPANSSWAGGAISSSKGQLLGAEVQAVAKAVAKRQQEFRAGRVYAREALGALGFADAEIPVGSARQPLWPSGITGSITHQDDFCVAAVIQQEHVRLLGIDLASPEPLRPELHARICNPQEIDYLRAIDQAPFDPFKLVFSMKESLFKCLYLDVGHYLGFHAVSVYPDFARDTAQVEIIDAALSAEIGRQTGIQAEFARLGDYIFTAAWVR